jgi:purine-binding chemotaxis protein CheW
MSEEKTMTRQIATFVLGETLLGVDILLVKEIYRQKTFSPIPDAPAELRGLMNLRGRVVTVIDLNVQLNRPPSEITDETRLLIFKTQAEIEGYIEAGRLPEITLGEDIVGFLIDRMDDVLTASAGDVLPPPPNVVDIDETLIDGVVKKGNQLVILLDVAAVLEGVLTTASPSVG